MSSNSSIFISCKKAAELIEMKQESALSIMGKLKLNIHLVSCKVCANYEKQSKLISLGLKNIYDLNKLKFNLFRNPELKQKIKSKLFDV
jgi:hypothetical protein